MMFIFFPDLLKFLSRLGARSVNDGTAHVTAGMDPDTTRTRPAHDPHIEN